MTIEHFENAEDAKAWLANGHNRMLIIKWGICRVCEDWFNNEMAEWRAQQQGWSFATITHEDWLIPADQFPEYEKTIIFPLGAPIPVENLDRMVRENG